MWCPACWRPAAVLDRLVLTATESVWRVHETDTALDDDDRKVLEEDRESRWR